LPALREVSSLARKRAAMVLGWIGNKKTVLPLTWALADKDPDVRKMAAWALGKIGDNKAITALEHTIDDHSKNDKIISEIAVLNGQQQILEDQIAALEDEIILQELPILDDQIAAIEDEIMLLETSEDETQNKTTEDREYHDNRALFKVIKEEWDYRPFVLAATMLEFAVSQKENIEPSIEGLEKVLQANKEIKEYAREAIQRLNYN